jgi:hypothetical protein
MEPIGNCEPRNLNSADMDCTVTLSASQSVEEGTDRQTSQSTTNTESKTITDGTEDNTQHELNVGIENEACLKGQVPGFTEIQAKMTIKYAYRRQVCKFQ